MTSPEDNWWSIRAGEYVLGTLRGEDLRLFHKILDHDTNIQAEVAHWERRLTPLNETTSGVQPAPHIWPLVLDKVRQLESSVTVDRQSRATELSTTAQSQGTARSAKSSRHGTRHRPVFWPSIAAMATAASVVLGVLLYQQEQATRDMLALKVDGLAVVLSDEEGIPYFLVETDYGNLRVRVTSIAPPELQNTQNLQLWQALPDRSEVRPVALLPEEPGITKIFDVSSLIDGSDLFGVSIEPVGAETEAGPTGPVVAHGDYLQTTPAD